ncbi:hypothetical protein ACH42_07890 [Endozoicomonas sp. (ex Bugula neritina AB1)]|nr:hypothetical protein ACH42_07890 [Endozoicomonas sp. (ex Bugula neritina AB1)]
MASRIKLIDVRKLPKNADLVARKSANIVAEAKACLKKQEDFMEEVGMDRKNLRTYINSDRWSAQQKHKARQELIRWNDEMKADIAQDVSAKRKEIRFASKLLNIQPKSTQTTRRRRTGFI